VFTPTGAVRPADVGVRLEKVKESMNTQDTSVIIDPEFRSLVPSISTEERLQLKENIRQRGLLARLILWRQTMPDGSETYTLVDGHHRLEILRELYPAEPELMYVTPSPKFYQFIALPNREAAKLWILEHQVGRRNLTKEQRVEMVAKIAVLRQEQTAKVQQQNLKKGNKSPEVGKMPTSGTKTIKALAAEFNVPQKPLQAAVTNLKDNQPKSTKCFICNVTFESKNAIGRHIREDHPNLSFALSPVNGGASPATPLQNLQPTTPKASPEPARRLKPIAYNPNSFHLTDAPKEPPSTEVFYVIQKNDGSYLCRHLYNDGEHFSKNANELNLSDVRRFAKPFDYTAVYYVPNKKRKEIELDRSEYRWVKVTIKMEPVNPKTKSKAACRTAAPGGKPGQTKGGPKRFQILTNFFDAWPHVTPLTTADGKPLKFATREEAEKFAAGQQGGPRLESKEQPERFYIVERDED